jgi:hypothetical protein|nr:MAG TPA: hypothetical protein [Bacteriophage sp.]
MSKAKKLCPFKKRITRTAKRGNRGELINELEEVFCKCEGTRCMAFRSGACQRLTQEKR